VLRKDEGHRYRLVGACYTHGLTDGKAMEEFEIILFLDNLL
jgi:hypothetical protein